MIDLRQTKEHAEYLKLIGWSVFESENGVKAFVRKLPLLPFSLMKIQRVKMGDIDFKWVNEVVKNNKVILSYIEPVDYVKKIEGYKRDSSPILNSKTQVVDLRKSEADILNGMKPKTRYNIGLTRKKDLIVEILDGKQMLDRNNVFDEYYQLMKENCRRLHTFEIPRKWIASQLEAFLDKAFVILVRANSGDLLAAAMYLCSGDSVFYSHNGSSELGRKLFAPTRVVWEGMLEGKRRELKWFDFEGVFDDKHPLNRWKGFSRFKKGFGGSEVTFPLPYRRWHLFG